MLNKNLFKRFSLLAFVMFFCFVLVLPVCFASNPNEETPNEETQNENTPNNHVPNTDAENKTEEKKEDYDWLEEIFEELSSKEKNDSEEEEEEEECGEGYNFNTEEESLEEEDTPELEVNDRDYGADGENYYYPGEER